MLSISENQKDWFEFILDLNLLDNYFKNCKEKNGDNLKYFGFIESFNLIINF
jgi:hypothetical protein